MCLEPSRGPELHCNEYAAPAWSETWGKSASCATHPNKAVRPTHPSSAVFSRLCLLNPALAGSK